MNDKDRMAMEHSKTTLYGDAEFTKEANELAFKQGFGCGLEHARKEQRELLERCEDVLKDYRKSCQYNAETNEYGAGEAWKAEVARLDGILEALHASGIGKGQKQ